jgi:hypothetical protein
MNNRIPVALIGSAIVWVCPVISGETVGQLLPKTRGTNPPATALLNENQVAEYAYHADFRQFGLVMSIAVCAAESSNYVDAIGRNTDKYTGKGISDDLGLWQINDYWQTDGIGHAPNIPHPFHAESLYDISQYGIDSVASSNATAAFIVSSGGTNWSPWTTYTNSLAFGKITAADSTIRSTAVGLDPNVITGLHNHVAVTMDGINVHGQPGSLDTRPVAAGTSGTIAEGPSVRPISGDSYPYIWWRIQWDDGSAIGWVAEDFLKNTSSASSGSPSDLAIKSISVSHNTYSPGGAITIGNVVKNIGGTNSPSYTISFYASTDPNITTSDYLIGSPPTRSGLGPGAIDTNTTTSGFLPNNLPPGNYYVGAIITASPDASAGNNVNLDPTPITLASSSNQNVTISDVYVNPASGNTQGFTTRFVANVTSPIAQNVLLGASIVFSGSGAVFSDPGNDVSASLRAGPQDQHSHLFTIPTYAPLGTYDVIFSIWADSNGNGKIDPASDTLLGSYTASGLLNVHTGLGFIHMTMSPQIVIDMGAQFRVDGGKSWGNGQNVEIEVGNHTVSFLPVPGWAPPADQQVSVQANQTVEVSGTYVLIPVVSQVTFSPTQGFTVTWTGNPALTYSVFRASDPNFSNSTTLKTHIPGSTPTYTDPAGSSSSGHMYYVVGIDTN